jgi:hypothetical protein
MRLDSDQKKSGLREVFTGMDYQPLADENATLSYSATPHENPACSRQSCAKLQIRTRGVAAVGHNEP